MPIWLICPKCGTRDLLDEGAGARCPKCGEVMALDAEAPTPPRITPRRRQRLLTIGAILLLLLLGGGTLLGLWLRVALRAQRLRGAQSTCLSNVKQIELAFLMYASDYDNVTAPANAWPGLLFPYMRDEQIFLCPADQRPAKHSVSSLYGAAIMTPLSYTQNASVDGQPLGEFLDPASTILHFDGLALSGGPEALDPRHKEGACVGFLDGHVQWQPPSWLQPGDWDGSGSPR